MSEIRKMNWEDKVWKAFLRAVAYIPPQVRMEALLLVVERSEELARARGSEVVEEEDLVQAAIEKTPKAYKRVSLQILSEQGLSVPSLY